MFNKDFYPTPESVAMQMLSGYDITGKVILEPSAGKGDLVAFLQSQGAKEVIACENNEDLQQIVKTKCHLIESDFLKLDSTRISHVDFIVMNPPFSNQEKHILHAWEIAPPGATIISLCNSTLFKDYGYITNSQQQIQEIVKLHGFSEDLGNCFSDAERKTEANVSKIVITKPAASYEQEFAGFFMNEDEEPETGSGLMSYNFVRDLVNRYIAALKLYDKQLDLAVQMESLVSFWMRHECDSEIHKKVFSVKDEDRAITRAEFKKSMQRQGWGFIFSKMNLTKIATRGLREDINKFVEQQTQIPFTMRNIYRMLDIVIGTSSQRMDKAILEVFDRVTKSHAENRYQHKGWKTNSHYLVGKKFILDYMISPAREYGYTSNSYNDLKSSYDGIIPDLEKALCFITGTDFEEIRTVSRSIMRNSYGEWYNSTFFRYKGYKNGNMHFEFISEDVWAMFNQRVAKLKGYPLFEAKEQTAYQNRQTGRAESRKRTASPSYKQPEEQLTLIED
jgi:16S rRNA G966 N2-methylase RsmD